MKFIKEKDLKECWSDEITDIIDSNFLQISFTELKTFLHLCLQLNRARTHTHIHTYPRQSMLVHTY